MNSNTANTEAVASPLLIEEAAQWEPRSLRWLLSQWWVPFCASSIFVVVGHLLIKSGLSAAAFTGATGSMWMRVLHCALQPQVTAGLFVYMLGSVCWIIAVAQQEISFLYPLSSMNYVLVVFASSAFFHEALSVKRLSGVGLIVLGMILMNRKGRVSEQ
jgi:drug/metabolite transporter (DMT)-like permease